MSERGTPPPVSSPDASQSVPRSDPHAPIYVLGHSEREFRRLTMQSRIYEAATVELLEDAGLGPGMHVLDIGSGVGDVSLLAATLVGPDGLVIGVDHNAEAVRTATARAARAGVSQVDFRLGGLGELTLDGMVDAVVGRFILMHQADPAEALREAATHVRPGGAVAMLESHIELSATVHSYPRSPLFEQVMAWQVEVIRAAGAHTDMGFRLREVFLRAGLPEPTLRLHALVGGGPDSLLYEYSSESLRSMMPLARELGIASLTEEDLDRLRSDLEAEVAGAGGVLVSPLVVAAWARLPG